MEKAQLAFVLWGVFVVSLVWFVVQLFRIDGDLGEAREFQLCDLTWVVVAALAGGGLLWYYGVARVLFGTIFGVLSDLMHWVVGGIVYYGPPVIGIAIVLGVAALAWMHCLHYWSKEARAKCVQEIMNMRFGPADSRQEFIDEINHWMSDGHNAKETVEEYSKLACKEAKKAIERAVKILWAHQSSLDFKVMVGGEDAGGGMLPKSRTEGLIYKLTTRTEYDKRQHNIFELERSRDGIESYATQDEMDRVVAATIAEMNRIHDEFRSSLK